MSDLTTVGPGRGPAHACWYVVRHLTWPVAGWTVRGLAREYVRMADAAVGPGLLAGRDRELAVLRRWRAEALTGRGRLVVLTGPPPPQRGQLPITPGQNAGTDRRVSHAAILPRRAAHRPTRPRAEVRWRTTY